MIALAVDIDHHLPQSAKQRRGNRSAIDPGGATAPGLDFATENELSVTTVDSVLVEQRGNRRR